MRRLTEVAAEIRHQQRHRPCAGLVVSGGHTAWHLMDALACRMISPVFEVEPLCARGIVIGGPSDGTKGGQVGDAGTLVRLRDNLLTRLWPAIPPTSTTVATYEAELRSAQPE